MLKRYDSTIDHLHNYLCKNPEQIRLQIHQSHIDNNKLFKSRFVSFIYISAIYLWVLTDMTAITTNFIYLTLQGYFITWLFYAVVLQDYLLSKYFGKQMPVCEKLRHYIEIIYQTALCFQVPITLVFWTFLFPILLRNNASTSQIIMNTNLHLGPLACLSFQLYYNNFSFPIRHLWVLTIYGTGYMIINLVYSLSVKVIYQPIDWKSLLSYSLLLGSYVFVIGAHYLARLTYRKWKAPRLKARITEGLIEQIQQSKYGNNFTQNSQVTDRNQNKDMLSYPSDAAKYHQTGGLITEGRKIETPQKDILL